MVLTQLYLIELYYVHAGSATTVLEPMGATDMYAFANMDALDGFGTAENAICGENVAEVVVLIIPLTPIAAE